MTKSPAQSAGVRLGPVRSHHGPNREDPAWAAWQRHVDAGRIGNRPKLDFDIRLRHMRNEVALFGRVVTRELGEF